MLFLSTWLSQNKRCGLHISSLLTLFFSHHRVFLFFHLDAKSMTNFHTIKCLRCADYFQDRWEFCLPLYVFCVMSFLFVIEILCQVLQFIRKEASNIHLRQNYTSVFYVCNVCFWCDHRFLLFAVKGFIYDLPVAACCISAETHIKYITIK